MRAMRIAGSIVPALPFALALACGSDNSSSNGSTTAATGNGSTSAATTASTTGGSSAVTTASTAPSGSAGTSPTAGSSAGDGGNGPPICALHCQADADCCPLGLPVDCPAAFPYDFECDGGFCRLGECKTDDDCLVSGMDTGLRCHDVRGWGTCVITCTADADCPDPSLPCSGSADDQTNYCWSPCTSDDDCGGLGTCSDGLCGCAGDGDCTVDGYFCATG